MTRLVSRFGAVNLVRRDRPLTRDELAHYVPSVFSEEKHESRSDRYTYIPTITLLDNLKREGFQPFLCLPDACAGLGIFDRVEEKRDAMQSLMLPPPAQQAMAKAALTYRFGEEHQPVTESQILSPRRWQDESNDLWTTYQRIQENLIKGGLSGLTTKGKRAHTRALKGIDGDVKLNRALWVMAENMLQLAS